MSGTTEELELTPARRPARERPQREVHREPESSIELETEGADQPSPEEALADTARQLKERDQQLAQARTLHQQAEQARIAAERAAAQTRGSASVSAIEAATAEQQTAEQAYIRARETGDIAAELAANKALSAATMRLAAATYEADQLKNQPAPQQQQRGQGPSAAAQAWLDAHPAYHSDRKYRGTAEVAHGEAIRAGMQSGSQEYVDYIDNIMTQEYGPGHGQTGTQVSRQAPQGRTSAPPSRHASVGGWKTVTIPTIGTIQFVPGPDGRPGRIKASQAIMDTIQEAAEFSRMDVKDYAQDLVEGAMDGNTDWTHGDGKRWE